MREYEFLSKTKGLDMLVGARVGKVKIPLIRKPPKWVLNKLANYLSDYSIPDLNSGLRIMKESVKISFIFYLMIFIHDYYNLSHAYQ